MKQKYFVVLGDVISSRRLRKRKTFQKNLMRSYKKINSSYKKDIWADFKILKGIDELGGVLCDISNIYRIISTILDQLHPYLIRFVVVQGRIDVGLNTKDVEKMDGPAFHRASKLMDRLKDERLAFGMSIQNDLIDTAISNQINLIIFLKNKWSVKQHKIINEYKKIGKQDEVAKKFGVTQQAISKIIIRSRWNEIQIIEERLNNLLSNYRRLKKQRGETNDREY